MPRKLSEDQQKQADRLTSDIYLSASTLLDLEHKGSKITIFGLNIPDSKIVKKSVRSHFWKRGVRVEYTHFRDLEVRSMRGKRLRRMP